MDFEDSPEEAEYRAAARAWLSAQGFPPGRGKRKFDDFADPATMSAGRAWQAAKAAAGYAAITWPREYGAGGGSPVQREIYAQEQRRFDTPALNLFDIGLGMCGPTVLEFAAEAQKQRLIPPLVRGEEVWCQLFSEPSAGSDLAAIRTRARPDGAAWVIDGQKVWTTYAQYADWGLLLARTNPDAPKHAGLTMFFVDMRSPGVTVRPLRQMAGVEEFNEVFFDGVVIPDAWRLGPVDGGWKTAIYTLMHERSLGNGDLDVAGLIEAARQSTRRGKPAIEDGAVRERIADAWLDSQGLYLIYCRALSQLSRGAEPGPECSLVKMIASPRGQDLASLLLDLAGPAGLDVDHAAQQRDWLMSARLRLAGGSDEILATILAERVLGLPQEPRPDKNTPFSLTPPV